MNNSHLYELIGESIWDTYSDMAYLIMEKKLGLGKKIALTTLACVGAACPGTEKPGGSAESSTPTIKSLLDEPGMKGKHFKGGKFVTDKDSPEYKKSLRKADELKKLRGGDS